jgi:hypothetical protein
MTHQARLFEEGLINFRPWRIILHHFHPESYENKK